MGSEKRHICIATLWNNRQIKLRDSITIRVGKQILITAEAMLNYANKTAPKKYFYKVNVDKLWHITYMFKVTAKWKY